MPVSGVSSLVVLIRAERIRNFQPIQLKYSFIFHFSSWIN